MLIGLVGKKGSGKDTLADNLVKSNYILFRRSIASGIRKISEMLFKDYLSERSDSVTEIKILQDIGNMMRDISLRYFNHSNVWLDYLFKNLNGPTVITDVRLPIEAEYILQHGGFIVYLDVNDKIRRDRCEKRDGVTYSDREWNDISSDDTETGVAKIVDLFSLNNRFFVIDGSMNPMVVLDNTVKSLGLRKKYSIYGEEPVVDLEAFWCWH